MGGESLLEARGVTKSVRQRSGDLSILRQLDLTLAARERVAIVGASGSGKSTLLHVLGGLTAPTAGEVLFQGMPLAYGDPQWMATYRNRTIGFVFQFFHLLPDLTALDNVALPLRIRGEGAAAAQARAETLLQAVGLEDRREAYPRTLSGGEQQRVALARAVAGSPHIVLADEPTGNLDAQHRRDLLELLQTFCAAHNAALVVVTHDAFVAHAMDRTLHLKEGRLHEASHRDLFTA